MTTGELLNLIGNDGIQEALQNRWIVPDMDTGLLTLNLGGGKLQELAQACVCACGKTDCSCEAISDSKQTSTMPMREAFAGYGLPHPNAGGGTPPPPMLPRPQAAASPTPTTPAGPQAKPPQIGDQVMVADENKTFTGTVGVVGQDGRYRIKFGNDKPPMDREYNANELRLVGQAPV